MKRFILSIITMRSVLCGRSVAEAAKPSIVYLLADDLGWGDISAHGGAVATPNIDRLFQQGVELRNFMGWCICSPTRAMLLTGRHPFRVGTGPEVGGELAKDETTIAEGFKANGYRTGVFGKWHNGDDPNTPEFQAAFKEAFKDMPNKKHSGGHGANAHGFDEAWIYYGGGADYFTRRTVQGRGPVSWWHHLEFRPQDAGYTDDLITQRAIEFIRENKARPFFCYVPFHLVHAPLQAKKDDLASMDPKVTAGLPAAKADTTTGDKHIHAAMLHALDQDVAAILVELDRLGLRDNTASPVESYYWAWRNQDALRTADWKLHRFFDHFELCDIRTDMSEATNVAEAHPVVVKSLAAKVNAWAKSLGAALTHQPAPMKLNAKPAPEGAVLEVTVTVTAQSKPNDRLVVPIAGFEGHQFATDYVEYDIATAAAGLRRSFYYSPFKGNDSKTITIHFKRGEGIDQFGREQATAPEIQGGPGVWEHRVIGLCSSGPGTLPRHGLVFKGGTPGTYQVYLDNLRLRHSDGSTTPIWTTGKDTRYRKIEDSETFPHVRVRTVPVSEVHP